MGIVSDPSDPQIVFEEIVEIIDEIDPDFQSNSTNVTSFYSIGSYEMQYRCFDVSAWSNYNY